MSRDGNGVYSLVVNSWNPAVDGNAATTVDWQSLIDDVATALTQSVSSDGQTPMTGDLNMNGNRIESLAAGASTTDAANVGQIYNQGIEQDVASAATTDIGIVNSNFIRITGTTTITSLGTNYRGPRFVRFSDALILTHNATTFILPGNQNIITSAGDRGIFVPKGNPSDGWICVVYQYAGGIPQMIQNQSVVAFTTAGTAPTFTVTTSPVYSTLATGQRMRIKWHQASSAPTLNRDGTGAINVKQYDPSGAKVTAVVSVNLLTDVEYDGTDYVILNIQNKIMLGTMVAASGTSVAFTGIPSNAKRVTMSVSAISTAGTNNLRIQLGDSGGLETSGYSNQYLLQGTGTSQGILNSAFGFPVTGITSSYYGTATFTLIDSATNLWACSALFGDNSSSIARMAIFTGSKSLSATLDRIALESTDGFDAGSVNITYEV